MPLSSCLAAFRESVTVSRYTDEACAAVYTALRAGFARAGHQVIEADKDGRESVYDLEGVLGPAVTQFVESHVRSLLAWDILVFFQRNPDAALDCPGLATRLGRRVEEVQPEVDSLCEGRILQCTEGVIHYRPTTELRTQVTAFVEACQDRGRRLALIALVLHRIGRAQGEA